MTVLGRGLIFQPVALACAYNIDTMITERDKQTDRQTSRQTDRQTDREMMMMMMML